MRAPLVLIGAKEGTRSLNDLQALPLQRRRYARNNASAYMTVDLGIAVGSAVSIAADGGSTTASSSPREKRRQAGNAGRSEAHNGYPLAVAGKSRSMTGREERPTDLLCGALRLMPGAQRKSANRVYLWYARKTARPAGADRVNAPWSCTRELRYRISA